VAQTFSCPSCGAPLHTDGTETNIQCEYCGETVVVPENLRHQAAPGVQPPPVTFQFGNVTVGINPFQIRQMMMAVRSGQLDEATQVFQQMSGSSPEVARQTVERIASHISGTGRISPDELSAFFGGGANLAGNIPNFRGASASFPARAPRRRSGNLGCLLVILILVFIAFTGQRSSNIFKTALAFFNSSRTSNQAANSSSTLNEVQTQIAPIVVQVTSLAKSVPSTSNVSAEALDAPLLSFGGAGTGQGLLNDSRSIAIDQQGQIYVADYTGGRVQVFDNQGKFLAMWRVNSEKPLQALAVDQKGVVYVDQGGQIQYFDGLSGKSLGKITIAGVTIINDIVVTPQGKLAIAQNGNQDNIYILEPGGKLDLKIPLAISKQSGKPELQTRLAVDGSGNIYALGTFNSAVFKFGPDGKFIDRFGGPGQGNGQFQAVQAIAVDGQGQVYVSDINGVQVFDENGGFIKSIKLPEGVPFGLSFNNQGNLFVSNRAKVFELGLK
jgi:DNA-binding beta-propeller fold protein YncE/DNA-directed RNA polymerase subunit RPC12/RpoP